MKKLTNLDIPGSYGRPIMTDVFIPDKIDSPIPIIIFCHGYKGFKDWGAWNQMGELLVNNGFCLVKFNFSFNGGTKEQPIDFPDLEAFANNNYSKELGDLTQIVDWVHANPLFDHPVDRSNISLMGHSRGGGIVSIAASEDVRIRNLITLAAVSDFESRFDVGSDSFKKWEESGVKYVLNGRTKQNMPHYFQFYKDFERNQERLNIERALRHLNKPHLILHGDKDTSVDVKAANDMAQWSKQAMKKIISGTDHVFGASHPWTQNELPDKLIEVVGEITTFVSNNLE